MIILGKQNPNQLFRKKKRLAHPVYLLMDEKKNIGKGLLRGVLSVNPNTPVSPSPVSIHNIPYLIPPPPLPPRVSATPSCADAAVKGRKTRK